MKKKSIFHKNPPQNKKNIFSERRGLRFLSSTIEARQNFKIQIIGQPLKWQRRTLAGTYRALYKYLTQICIGNIS